MPVSGGAITDEPGYDSTRSALSRRLRPLSIVFRVFRSGVSAQNNLAAVMLPAIPAGALWRASSS